MPTAVVNTSIDPNKLSATGIENSIAKSAKSATKYNGAQVYNPGTYGSKKYMKKTPCNYDPNNEAQQMSMQSSAMSTYSNVSSYPSTRGIGRNMSHRISYISSYAEPSESFM